MSTAEERKESAEYSRRAQLSNPAMIVGEGEMVEGEDSHEQSRRAARAGLQLADIVGEEHCAAGRG